MALTADLNGAGAGSNNIVAYTEDSSAVAIAAAGAMITGAGADATVANITVKITDLRIGDVLSVVGTLPSGITHSIASDGTLTLSGVSSQSAYAAALQQIFFSSTSADPTFGNSDKARTVSVIVNDGLTNGTATTATVNITAVNDAPTALVHEVAMTAISEDSSPAGETALSLFRASFFDPDSNGGAFFAVTENGAAFPQGVWQYHNGTAWVDVGSVSESAALVIDRDTIVRFLPSNDFNGPAPALKGYYADASEGRDPTGSYVDVSVRGGTTRYSSDQVSLLQEVSAVNDAPVNQIPDAQDGFEDVSLIFSDDQNNAILVRDPDGAGAELTVTLAVEHGTLTLADDSIVAVSGDGTGTLVLTGIASLINVALDGLTYRPNTDYFGLETLTVTTSDGGSFGDGGALSNTDTVQITVADAGLYEGTPDADGFLAWNNDDWSLYGFDGNDVLQGAGGNDFIDGGSGADFMIGGRGSDLYIVDDIGDLITENSNLTGVDTVRSSISFVLGSGLEDLVLTGIALIGATGNDDDNILIGNDAANTLSGGLGADTLIGGLGDDIYVIDDADVLTELANGGTDTVRSSSTYALLATFENLELLGSGDIDGLGNSMANILSGNDGSNLLDGGAGADQMAGARGSDIYVVDNASDVVQELPGQGSDKILSSISYQLSSNVETLVLTGTAAINGTGNSAANMLVGNDAANVLDGRFGADQMSGGKGSDRYIVNDTGDVVTELANSGTDLVESSASYTLSAFVENLKLTGIGGTNGTGNGLNNNIGGNTGSNNLSGGGGNDFINGGGGADTMVGGTGDDTYVVDDAGDLVVETAGAGVDTVYSSRNYTLGDNVEKLELLTSGTLTGTGNGLDNHIRGNVSNNILRGLTGNDTIFGGDGNDRIFGGAGSDVLTGGRGYDQFMFDTAPSGENADVITDFTHGTDRIYLDRSVFSGFGQNGTINKSAFQQGTTAADADDRILYDQASGNIFHDADGTGGAAAILFATVMPGLALTHSDFTAYFG